MEKVYLAVVHGTPQSLEWTCRLRLAPNPQAIGRMRVDARQGKEAETHFRLLQSKGSTSLIEARPVTGRTHQIRVHLAECGCPVLGDSLYGPQPVMEQRATRSRPFPGKLNPTKAPLTLSRSPSAEEGAAVRAGEGRKATPGPPTMTRGGQLGLRAVRLAYEDPFVRRQVEIRAPLEQFIREYGFDLPTL
jgi:hypothetical protein